MITFAGERVLVFDAVALGLLRHQIIDLVGIDAARSLFTQFGYMHGWRTADSLEDALPWKSEREWKVAGGRLHRLQGLVSFEPITTPPEEGGPPPFAQSLWRDSYEAEQHLLHLGRSDEPVCWSLVGFASGYLSRVTGKTIYCLESQCRGRGDAVCRMEGRPKDEWDTAHQEAFTRFEPGKLSAQLKHTLSAIKQAERELTPLRHTLETVHADPSGLVAWSDAQREVVQQARRLAAFDVTVLLTGEPGVGKKRLARLIHERSARQAGPFITHCCGALPGALLEAELFGQREGSATDRVGIFESARGGTLLLDEVGELPPGAQARVLSMLKDQDATAGAARAAELDVRLLAASRRNLQAEVDAGRFRPDLYFRLKVVELRVPPLRAHPEDILPLAELALAEAALRSGRPPRRLSPTARRRLVEYAWPGNVGELKSAMARAALLSEGPSIELSDLPDELWLPVARLATGAGLTLAAAEKEHILATLEALGGQTQEAALQLGLTRASLARKLKHYRLG